MDLKPVLIDFVNRLLEQIDLIRITWDIKKVALISIDRIEEFDELHYKIYFTINWKSRRMLDALKDRPSILIGTSSDSFAKQYYFFSVYGLDQFDISLKVEKRKIKMVVELTYKEPEDTTKHYRYLIVELGRYSEEEFDRSCLANPLMDQLCQSESFMDEIKAEREKRLKLGFKPKIDFGKHI